MLKARECLVSFCCRCRFKRSARVVELQQHPCNVFLPQAIARDHAIEIAHCAAEAAHLSAANADRAVKQLLQYRNTASKVFQEAARRAEEFGKTDAVVIPQGRTACEFTVYDMCRVSRELVRANST